MAEKSKRPVSGSRKTSAGRKPTGAKKSPASQAAANGTSRKKPAKRKKTATPKRRSVLGQIASWSLVVMIWASVAVGGALVWYGWDLPDIDDAVAEGRRPAVNVLAGDGSRIVSFGDVFGLPVQAHELPVHLKQAVIATEDRRFYDHFGIDPIGIARALVTNLTSGQVRQGGSTLTQQLAKNLFLSPERTIKRKVQEVMLSVWLEHKFTKDQILTIYLNRVYLGSGVYGVDAAARRYYGKPATKLGLYEGAAIAGMLKAPSRYNPATSQSASRERTAVVLDNMINAGFITPDLARTASAGGAAGGGGTNAGMARHFADWILDRAPAFAPVGGKDLTVITTIEPELQRNAEKMLSAIMRKQGEARNVDSGAIVILRPDGAIAAMVGGPSYASSQYNMAVQARRQPGSAFKPVVFLAALESGMSPSDIVQDRPFTLGTWAPRNYDRKFRGPVSLTDALADSLNVPTARLYKRVGHDHVVEAARRLGFVSDFPRDATIALGSADASLLELTTAFAVFANAGGSVQPYGIREIRSRDGETLYRRPAVRQTQVVNVRQVADMHEMLRAVIDRGTGKAAQIRRPAGGKSGTSQSFRDAWFVGYTADYATGVWMGAINGGEMDKVTGGSLPAQLWRDLMLAAHKGLPPRALPLPAGTDQPRPTVSAPEEPGLLDRLLERLASG